MAIENESIQGCWSAYEISTRNIIFECKINNIVKKKNKRLLKNKCKFTNKNKETKINDISNIESL